jgi:hypothetical protein
LQYWGRSNTHQHWFAIGLRFGQKFFNVAFCSYLHHQFFNWAAVPGGRFSNSPKSQSPTVVRYFMRPQIIAYLLFTLTACGQTKDNSQKGSAIPKNDTTQKLPKNMSEYSPTFDKAHPKAKALLKEEFYFSPIDETGPFGNDDGADTYAGFKDWRKTHANENPKVFLLEQIDYWGYPKFDIYETDIKKLTPYLKQSDLGSRYMSGICKLPQSSAI